MNGILVLVVATFRLRFKRRLKPAATRSEAPPCGRGSSLFYLCRFFKLKVKPDDPQHVSGRVPYGRSDCDAQGVRKKGDIKLADVGSCAFAHGSFKPRAVRKVVSFIMLREQGSQFRFADVACGEHTLCV